MLNDNSSWKSKKFWEHYCEVEKDIMGTELGEECNWCGEKEPSGNLKKTAGERLYGYHPQELLTKKILPIDIFYKLFGQKL